MVSHNYPPHVGGLEVVAASQAHSLAARHHNVAVVTSSADGAPLRETTQGVAINRVKASHFFDTHFGIPFPLFSPGIYRQLKHKIKLSTVVHIHDVFYISSWVAGILAIRMRKPLYITQHVGLVAHPNALVMLIQKIVYGTIGKFLFHRAAHVVVYNRHTHTFVKRQGVPASRITELRNGIDTGYFTPATAEEKRELRRKYSLPEDGPICLYVGRLVPKKGYQLLLDALKRTKTQPLALFVGPGKQPPAQHNARFMGARRGAALRDFYRLADVCVIPSKDEIFTLVHQEAMACGLPVITTDEPGYRAYQVERDHMALVERNEKDIASALDRVLGDLTLQWRMGEYSRRLAVERFDWEKNIEELVQLYPQKGRS